MNKYWVCSHKSCETKNLHGFKTLKEAKEKAIELNSKPHDGCIFIIDKFYREHKF